MWRGKEGGWEFYCSSAKTSFLEDEAILAYRYTHYNKYNIIYVLSKNIHVTILLAHDPLFIINLPYDHPHPSRSRQFALKIKLWLLSNGQQTYYVLSVLTLFCIV